MNVDSPSVEEINEGKECGPLGTFDAKDMGEPETIIQTTTPVPDTNPPSPKRASTLTSIGPCLSSEDFAKLKQDNPLAYLRSIISARESSTDKSVSILTTSGDKSPSDPCNALLQKLKAKIFDVDLFQLLENNNLASYELKNLLKQAEQMDTFPEVSAIVIELGIMVEQVVVDVIRV